MEEHETFEGISKLQYLALKCRGLVPYTLPSICVLVIKNDKDGRPDWAKLRIVVLENHEDSVHEKSKRFAPVLHYSSFCLLTSKGVEDRRILQQGDCKKTCFVKRSCLRMNRLLSARLLRILPFPRVNFGCSGKLCMAFTGIRGTGMICLGEVIIPAGRLTYFWVVGHLVSVFALRRIPL